MTKQSFARISAFAHRVFLELVRDSLSYIFALGFPLIMLAIMTLVNASIPSEAAMTLFAPASLVPGIAVFGLTFLTLFTAILLAGDRESGFLMRLTVSPMRAGEFLAGYMLPLFVLAVLQGVIAYAAGWICAFIQEETIRLSGIFAAMLISVPAVVFFLAFGFLIGCLFGSKSAPGVASVMITAASLLGGIWMDADAMGGVWLKICRCLPFYHAVRAARLALSGGGDGMLASAAVMAGYAVLLCVIASAVFVRRKRIDQ